MGVIGVTHKTMNNLQRTTPLQKLPLPATIYSLDTLREGVGPHVSLHQQLLTAHKYLGRAGSWKSLPFSMINHLWG